MAKLYETLPIERQLEMAVRTNPPARLAQTFAGYAGQFYDRTRFDQLAREVSALYEVGSPDDASAFRARLDRRLADRYRAPVAWDASCDRAA